MIWGNGRGGCAAGADAVYKLVISAGFAAWQGQPFSRQIFKHASRASVPQARASMPLGTFRAVWSSKPVGRNYSPAGRYPPPQSAVGVAQKEELTMDNHDVIATLNDLLEISRDGEQGFRTCAEGVQSPNLKALFEAAARRCAAGTENLSRCAC